MQATLPTHAHGPLPMDVRLTRWGANVLLALVAVGVIGGVGRWVLRHPGFQIRQVVLEGDVQHNTARGVQRQVSTRLAGASYFGLSLSDARDTFEAVPWVRRAQVRRVWPDRLVVKLEEHRPVAYWRKPGAEDLLVNDHGEVFEVNLGDLDDDKLPYLSGPADSAPQVLDMWRQLHPEFRSLQAGLDALSLSERGNWQGRLDNGLRLELGRGTAAELVVKVRRFVASLPAVQAQDKYRGRAVESADLRHPDGYALRIAGITTVDKPMPEPASAPVSGRTGAGRVPTSPLPASASPGGR